MKTGEANTASVPLSPDAIQKTLEQFELVTEATSRPPRSFTLDDLTAFLAGTPDARTGYAAGLPVPRRYVTARGRSLPNELLDSLRELEEAEPSKSPESVPRRRATTLTLPCAGGSDATTLLREAAFQAAGEGYPALFLRPGVTDIDTEVLIAFATALSESALGQSVASMPPLAIVLDVGAADLRSARQLAGTLAAQGRPAVVLRAVPDDDHAHEVYLTPLRAETTPEEARRCEETFGSLVRRWNLPIDRLPTLDEWLAYEARSRWITPTGPNSSKSLFWVALRFFLTGGLDRGAAQSVRDALGRWIAERDERVTDEGMRKVLRWVAAPVEPADRLSADCGASSCDRRLVFVLACADPSAVGRPAGLARLLARLRRLHHPVPPPRPGGGIPPAVRRGSGPADRGSRVNPLLRQLIPGRPADRWLAERLVTDVLTPTYQDRQQTDWGWRLAAFGELPEALAMDSRPILHHWARCLYQSADPRNDPDMPTEERRRRFGTAIKYLRHALQLPRRQPREEHPSHLWNTLGVACSRLGRFLDTVDPPAAKEAWNEAWEAFRKAHRPAPRKCRGTSRVQPPIARPCRRLRRTKI